MTWKRSSIVNMSESVAAMAACTNKTPREVKAFFDAISILAEQTVKAMDMLVLPGLGRLVAQNRAARMGRNPATGQQIAIKAKRVVKFRVAKSLKDAVPAPRGTARATGSAGVKKASIKKPDEGVLKKPDRGTLKKPLARLR